MKAAYIKAYGGPEQIIFGELEDPVPSKGQVLIRTGAASVNPVDWKVREGRLKLFSGRKFPLVLGTELAGTVLTVGSHVDNFNPGDRVFAGLSHRGGAYAELAVAAANKSIRIPDSLSFEDACTLAVAGLTALQSFTIHYNVMPGHSVLVNGGSGGVGTYAIQIAKLLGAHVTAVCSERNIELVKSLGADDVIDYNKEDFRSRREAFDVVLDAAANAFFPAAEGCLKKGGMLIKLNLSIDSLFRMITTRMFSNKRLKMILVKNRKDDFLWLMDQIEKGTIRVILDKKYSLDKAREAQEYSQSGRARGKIVLIP